MDMIPKKNQVTEIRTITKRKVIGKFSNVGKQKRIEIAPYLSAL
jgi:hypothetical protein